MTPRKPFFGLLTFALTVCLFASRSTDAGTDEPVAQGDTLTVALDNVITVKSVRINREEVDFPMELDRFAAVINSNGFGLIRKGTFFAQDISVDGFKRGDVTVTVDGERYHSACPARMDSPLIRANPLEMQTIELRKNAAGHQSGLGGGVTFHRAPINEQLQIRAGLSQTLGSSENADAAFSVDRHNLRLTGRYARGKGYENGDDRTFADLYMYRGDYRYLLGETSVAGRRGEFEYRGAFTYTEDVMFPYLHMDERLNRIYSGFVSHGDHKLYFSHTFHTMDNGLRKSMSSMKSDATAVTVGFDGDFYEAYYRYWSVENRIVTPMTTIDNHMLPDVRQVAATFHRTINHRSLEFSGKLGFLNTRVGDKPRMAYYRNLYANADDARTFAVFGFSAGYTHLFAVDRAAGARIEITSEPPQAEELYIALQRPGNKTWRAGNPGLTAPVRMTLRGNVSIDRVRLELFGCHVWEYVTPSARMIEGTKYETYDNVGALLAGVSLSSAWKHLAIDARYTIAERTDTDSPMSEIMPLSVKTSVVSPEWHGLKASLTHIYSDAQTRVDRTLDEEPTPQWNRLDMELAYKYAGMRFSLGVENLTDELYYAHMSYMRNPYSSGTRVYEPGRTVRFNLTLDRLFEE